MLQEVRKNYFKKRANDILQSFWAGVGIHNGLTIKLPDGKETLVEPNKIWLEDLGSLSGHCMCGHAIRYQYWFDDVGPIGSTCIQTLTGLQGQDLRKLLQSLDLAKKEMKDFDLYVEREGTLGLQLENHEFFRKAFEYCKQQNLMPKEAEEFIENDVPFPWSVRNRVQQEYEKVEIVQNIENEYGVAIAAMWEQHHELVHRIKKIVNGNQDYLISLLGEGEKLAHITLEDIGLKIRSCKASEKAATFFERLYNKLSDPRYGDALNVLTKLDKAEIDNLFWTNIIKENLEKLIKYGLSDGQLNFVLDKAKSGKAGLAVRFQVHLIDKEEDNATGLPEQDDRTTESQSTKENKKKCTIKGTGKIIVTAKNEECKTEEKESGLDFDVDMPLFADADEFGAQLF